jgi:hypothetical protein
MQAMQQAERLNVRIAADQRQQLQAIARINARRAAPPAARPLFGRLLSWGQQRLAQHLGVSSPEPVLDQQEQFNYELLNTLLPLLEKSLSEQRRLQRDIDLLQTQVAARHAPERPEEQ